jgi:hypothetical protein
VSESRALAISIAAAALIAAYTIVWWGWPLALGLGTGVLLGGLALMTSVSLGPDPADADAAWRAEAADLVEDRRDAMPRSPSSGPATPADPRRGGAAAPPGPDPSSADRTPAG